jgi:type I restriction enzyme S subunit
MQSDQFMDRAEKISVGSLSPTINWSTLRDEEFTLPPIEEQARALRVLKQAAWATQCCTTLNAALDALRSAYLRTAFDELRCPTQAVAELTDSVSKGESPRWQGFEYVEHGPLFITSEHVLDGTLSLMACKHIPDEFHKKLARSEIRGGDVLINLVGASIGRAAIAPDGLGRANTNQAVAVVRFDKTLMLPEFFLAWYLSPGTQQSIAATRVNTARANVSLTDIRRLKVPVPSLAEQRMVVTRSHVLTMASQANTRRADMTARIQQRLLCALAQP